MGVRFRKRVKILPGVRMNFSKSGVSLNIGRKGASVSVGKKGAYLNAGIPGTGIYSREKINSTNKRETIREQSTSAKKGCAFSLLALGLFLFTGFCLGGNFDWAFGALLIFGGTAALLLICHKKKQGVK